MKAQAETIRTDDFTMDFFRFGHGEKAFVILPGLSVESVLNYADAVAKAYSLLTDRFTVFVFDRRNELPAEYSVQEMARDTAAAFRVLGLEQVCLFGASQGGMIAMEIAAEAPELVSRLIIGSSSACITDEQYQAVGRWVQLAEAGNAGDLYLAFGEAVWPREVFEQSRNLLAESSKNVTEENLRRFVVLAEGLKDFDAREKLRKIACPVLVIGSADDRVLGADASGEIAKLLKDHTDVELYMYDGYGHAAYDTAPDYKERILRFLAQE